MKKTFKLVSLFINPLLALTLVLPQSGVAQDRHLYEIPFHQGAYNLNELEFLTKNLNFEVQKNAWKVYEAKELVTVKMAEFLPSANFNNLLTAYSITLPRQAGPYQYQTFGDVTIFSRGKRAGISRTENVFRNGLIASTFLGFLFPSSWYDFLKTDKLYKAEKLSFEALLANQVSSVKDLYINIHLIKTTLNAYQKYLEEVKQFQSWVDDISHLYGFNQIEESYTKLVQFRDELERQVILVREKYKDSLIALSDVTGIPEDFSKSFDIAPIEVPEKYRRFTEEEKNLFEKITLHASREIQNHAELVSAAEYGIGARQWAWLHPNAVVEGSLGFGYFSYIDIGRSEYRRSVIESSEVLESVRSGIKVAFISHDTTLDLIEKNTEGLEKSRSYHEDLKLKFGLGQLSLSQYIEYKRTALEKIYFFEMLMNELHHEALATENKIARLTWQGESYQNLQSYIPTKKLSKNDWWQREEILNHQSKKGYNVVKLEVAGKQFPKGKARFVNGLIFPKVAGFTYGDWDIDRNGNMSMNLFIDGVNYKAKGKALHMLFGRDVGKKFDFLTSIEMKLAIFDGAGNSVGTVEFKD